MSALAQDGRLPLHVAVKYRAGLEVVEALLQAHPHGATVADTVRGGSAGCGVVWMCGEGRASVCICVHEYPNMYACGRTGAIDAHSGGVRRSEPSPDVLFSFTKLPSEF